jgi:hypothetical protein
MSPAKGFRDLDRHKDASTMSNDASRALYEAVSDLFDCCSIDEGDFELPMSYRA